MIWLKGLLANETVMPPPWGGGEGGVKQEFGFKMLVMVKINSHRKITEPTIKG